MMLKCGPDLPEIERVKGETVAVDDELWTLKELSEVCIVDPPRWGHSGGSQYVDSTGLC